MPSRRDLTKRRVRESEVFQDLVPSLPAAPLISPLFTVCPAEIRNRIYTFVLESEDTSTEDSPSLYKRNAFYYRPGYKQPKRIETALLQTCQQIYAEASLLPPAVNEHTFWFYRAPPHIRDASSPSEYFRRMTPKQRAHVQHLHLFTQQYFLEDRCWSNIWDGIKIGNDGRKLRGECRIAPKRMTITFRHTDWWHWEDNEPLGIDPFRTGRTRAAEMGTASNLHNESRAWGTQFDTFHCLNELVIEFETVMRKRGQLDDIIQRALEWKFPLQPDKDVYLVADSKSKGAYTWVGAEETQLKRQRPAVPRLMHNEVGSEVPLAQEQELGLAAPVLKPFDVNEPVSHSELDQNTELFYVVFLTWRKQLV
ncbi:uncharacterized protein N7515_010376 [Penicillium bovifimosum]|uniref:Uncharacterized protein n=1 Tax=Penicillium bovifimosum TaxID=126998 RepID=A0A9W9KTN9_9EURO|nr:uncharacterized protein N7515_010376 [Penicillium bovifimosum]KAJ5118153.1 hypothetical protein N7515_010376 [Penicillium bovifimosum]